MIPKEVVDWFIALEQNVILTDEEVDKLKNRRPKVTIKNNIINW